MTSEALGGLGGATPGRANQVVVADGGGALLTTAQLLGQVLLSDLPAGGAAAGQRLGWNGANWVPTTLGFSDVTAALAYTPYNAGNPAGYVAIGAVSGAVATALPSASVSQLYGGTAAAGGAAAVTLGANLSLAGGTLSLSGVALLSGAAFAGAVTAYSGGAASLASTASPLGWTSVGTNAAMTLASSGHASVQLATGNGIGFSLDDPQTGALVNYLSVKAAITGVGATLRTQGGDSNVSMLLHAKGTGGALPFSFSSDTQSAALVQTGALSVNPGANGGTTWGGAGSGAGTCNLFAVGSISGTLANTVSDCTAYYYSVPSDTVNAAGMNAASPIVHAMSMLHNFGGGGASGARTGFGVYGNMNGVMADGNGSYVGATFQIQSNQNNGGINTGPNSKGFLYGIYPQAVLHAGATNWTLLCGGETDIAINSGASSENLVGHQIVALSTHAVPGAVTDCFLKFGSQPGAAGLATGLQFGSIDGQFPLGSSGTLFEVCLQTVNGVLSRSAQFRAPQAFAGLDAQAVNFSLASGYAVRGPGFSADGIGQIVSGNAVLGHTSAGVSLDLPNQIVTGATVSAAGSATGALTSGGTVLNNYYPGDILNGPSTGQYQVATTQVIAATVAAGGTGGITGTQTVTGTTGTGTRFQASVTVALGAITAVLSIAVAGAYTANPATPTAEPVTGGGLTGAQLALGIGVATLNVLVPDVAAAGSGTYANPVALANGSGAGCTATLAWATRNTLTLTPSGVTAFAGAHADQSAQVTTPSAGNTVTVPARCSWTHIAGAATLATLTIALGSIAPVNGQVLTVSTAVAITALTLSGATVTGAPASLAAGAGIEFRYLAASTTWVRTV